MEDGYYCMSCNGKWDTEKDINAHPCSPNFSMVYTKFHDPSQRRFIDRILSLDIGYGLAVAGLIVVNAFFLRHLNLGITGSIIEALSIGFAIPRLLK